MRRSIVFFLVAVCLVFSLACGEEKNDSANVIMKTPDTDKNIAKTLWTTDISQYTKWDRIPGVDIIEKSKNMPHAEYSYTHANNIFLNALNDGSTIVPDGSIVVMRCLNEEMETIKVVSMKRESGSWFYSAYDPSGAVLQAGKEIKCAECHDDAGEDGLFFFVPEKAVE